MFNAMYVHMEIPVWGLATCNGQRHPAGIVIAMTLADVRRHIASVQFANLSGQLLKLKPKTLLAKQFQVKCALESMEMIEFINNMIWTL